MTTNIWLDQVRFFQQWIIDSDDLISINIKENCINIFL